MKSGVFALKIRDKPPVGSLGFLGEALQVVEEHPAQHRVVFFVGDPPVHGGCLVALRGVLAHEAHQNLSGAEGFPDPV